MERIKKIVNIYDANAIKQTFTYMDTVESVLINDQKLKRESRELKIDMIIDDVDNSERIKQIDLEISVGDT